MALTYYISYIWKYIPVYIYILKFCIQYLKILFSKLDLQCNCNNFFPKPLNIIECRYHNTCTKNNEGCANMRKALWTLLTPEPCWPLSLTSGLLILSRSAWLGVPTSDNTLVSWSISVSIVKELKGTQLSLFIS